MSIKQIVVNGFVATVKSDLKSIYYVLYYTLVESLLVLSIPLVSSFVINSLMAHSSISVIVLGSIISIVFVFIVFLRLLQAYIIEKFQQRVFVQEGLDVADKAIRMAGEHPSGDDPIDKLMNYFFDITTIQKVFPVLVLNGAGLVVQIVMSLILLMIFDFSLFFSAFIIFTLYIFLLFAVGRNGVGFAIERSNTKHSAIYYLQKVPGSVDAKAEILGVLDRKMEAYIEARRNHFRVMQRQLALSFIVQGLIIAGFFIQGGYLVMKGDMPIGEFVAAEILIVTLIYAINNFVKQLDYIYEGMEGFYKIGKLNASLEAHHHEA